ncbi:hypothetical protein E2X65_23825 [Salmonella enterica]|nr:hypothetical protein [Salmonella enterica]
MATILNQTHPLLTIPFNVGTDFTTLADYCDHLTEALIETDDPTLRLVLCKRLTTCLTLLRPTLNDPIPPHLFDRLTVDTQPASTPRFEPDSEVLCDYCLALAQLLTENAPPPKMAQTLTGLLADLVWYFADDMRAPRWIRIASGVKRIDEVIA